MTIPACLRHGRMAVRRSPSPDAAWCGTWHDCSAPRCASSHLTPSPELRAFLNPNPNKEGATNGDG